MLKRRLVYTAVFLAVLVAAAALAVASSSHTPLPAQRGATQPETVDLDAYRRGELQFPGARWEVVDPELLGWSEEGLESARHWAEGLDTGAVFVVHRGIPVAAWGDTEERFLAQSMRKSLLSALLGRVVEAGRLDLDASLAELGVDDDPPLTPEERRATVRQLLLSRSGVYHSALYETPNWKRNKPERGAHSPGEAWYYNNWGFNALGTLFETASGLGIGEAFDRWIAGPLEMQDFRPSDVEYLTRDHFTERAMGNASDHAAYMFQVSTRDLARFGLLYAAGGTWDGQRVLPRSWSEESTFGSALETGLEDLRYGYMWWTVPPAPPFDEPLMVARGGRGHRLVIAPELDLVIVHRVPSRGVGLASQLYRRFVWSPSVDGADIDEMLARIVAAHPARRQASLRPNGGSGTPPG